LPKAVYLIGDDLVTEEHRKCVDVLRARNVPVFYPEGGIAVGERFHYVRDQAPETAAAARLRDQASTGDQTMNPSHISPTRITAFVSIVPMLMATISLRAGVPGGETRTEATR
jgi:hypothetical protein